MNTVHQYTDQICKTSGSRWDADQQKLHIDLEPLLGKPATLILSGWDAGISWQIVTDNETENYTDPFGEPPFPIEFFDHDLLKPWVATIPDNILDLLKKYKGNAFGMLMLVNRHPYLREPFEDHPALFWFAHTFAQDNDWNEDDFEKLCNRKRTEILNICGLPGRSPAVNLLRKIQANHYNRYTYDQIRELFQLEDYAILNHRSSIPLRLIALLNKHPPLLHSKFIFSWEGQWSLEETQLIEDVIRMVSTLQLGDYINFLNRCCDLEALTFRHDRLSKRMNDFNRRLLGYENTVQDQIVYPAPPLSGNEVIVPILDSSSLKAESQLQQICVAAYNTEIRLGRYFVYRVLEPERATLGVTILRMKNGQVSLRIDQLKGFGNRKVSVETEHIVLAWFHGNKPNRLKSEFL